MVSLEVSEHDNEQMALAWLREVLLNFLERATSIPRPITERTRHQIQRVPKWVLASWANDQGVNFVRGSQLAPDLAQEVEAGTFDEKISQYLESGEVGAMVRALQRVITAFFRLQKAGRLSVEAEKVLRGVAALALVNCGPGGREFRQSLSGILGDSARLYELLDSYEMALERGHEQKLDGVDMVLSNCGYGKWLSDRLAEARRWQGGEIQPNVRWQIEYMPDNGDIYKILLRGGRESEN